MSNYMPPIVGEKAREPKFIRPSLLTHPNIPKPLHGVNPRSILGQAWWDEVRQAAYKKNNYCCWACGVHKSMNPYHQGLEAHEYYDIDYKAGRMELKEIVALCHTCHNFIHSGRMWILYQKRKFSREKLEEILQYGFDLLDANNLRPFWGTYLIKLRLDGYSDIQSLKKLKSRGYLQDENKEFADWGDWHLVLNGEKHYSPYKNELAWSMRYAE